MTRAIVIALLMMLCIGIEGQKVSLKKVPKLRTIITKSTPSVSSTTPTITTTTTLLPSTTEDVTNQTMNVESTETRKFLRILSTLEERLNATMDEPYMQTERDRILERTRDGLNECKEGFQWTNVRSRYRLCIDRQVQTALKRARRIEGDALNKMPPNMRRMRPGMEEHTDMLYEGAGELAIGRPIEGLKPPRRRHRLPGMLDDYAY